MFYVVNIKNRIISDFSARTASKNIGKSNFGLIFNHPDYENLKIRNFWTNLTVFGSKIPIFRFFSILDLRCAQAGPIESLT